MFLQRYPIIKILLVLLAILVFSGCTPQQAPVIEPSAEQEEVQEIEEEASLINGFEILHADSREILAYVHGDHWHGALPFIQEEDELVIDIRVENSQGEMLYPDGTDLSLGIQKGEGAEEVFTIESYDGHLHIQGNQVGKANIIFYVEQAGEVIFQAPSMIVTVTEKVENIAPIQVPEVYSYDLIDRSLDRVTADVHGNHWHGSIPPVKQGEYVSLGAVIKDTQGQGIVLDGQPFSVAARVADQGQEAVVSFDFHGDHLHIVGESTGDTLLIFMLLADDESVFETSPIAVKVIE